MKFFHFDSFDENYDSNSSDSVSDPWSEFDDEKRNHRVSKEAQEASIQEQFKDAVEALQNSNQQKALQILMSMFLSEPMREFYVENWRDFDWTAAANKSQRILSSMAKIYFSVNIALAGLVENPTSFYMQALSIYPRLTDVWFACGNEAARHGDWALAEFCFRKCEGEFRASEALLLLYFVTDELHKCLNCVAEILSHCADHCLARVIYAEMVRRDPLWAETFSAVFSIDFIATVDQTVHNTIISKIKCFRDSTSSHKRNTFVELLSLTRRSLAAFPIVLRRDMRMEELGTILCDAFSRIEMFSSLFKQNIIVTESREQVENDVCDDMIPSTSEYEFIDPAELVDERAVLDKIVSFVSGDMSNADEEAKQKIDKAMQMLRQKKMRQPTTAEIFAKH